MQIYDYNYFKKRFDNIFIEDTDLSSDFFKVKSNENDSDKLFLKYDSMIEMNLYGNLSYGVSDVLKEMYTELLKIVYTTKGIKFPEKIYIKSQRLILDNKIKVIPDNCESSITCGSKVDVIARPEYHLTDADEFEIKLRVHQVKLMNVAENWFEIVNY